MLEEKHLRVPQAVTRERMVFIQRSSLNLIEISIFMPSGCRLYSTVFRPRSLLIALVIETPLRVRVFNKEMSMPHSERNNPPWDLTVI